MFGKSPRIPQPDAPLGHVSAVRGYGQDGRSPNDPDAPVTGQEAWESIPHIHTSGAGHACAQGPCALAGGSVEVWRSLTTGPGDIPTA